MFIQRSLWNMITSPQIAWRDADIIIKSKGIDSEAMTVDDKTGNIIYRSNDHHKVINKAIEYIADSYDSGLVLLKGIFKVTEPIIVPVTNYKRIFIAGSVPSPNYLFRSRTEIWSYVENDFTFKPDVEDPKVGVSGGMAFANLFIRCRGKNTSGIWSRNTLLIENIEISQEGYVDDTVKTIALVVNNGNAYIVQNVYIHNFHAGIVISHSEHGLIQAIHIACLKGYEEFGILMPHYSPSEWYDAGYTVLDTSIGSRHHVFIDIHLFGSVHEKNGVPASGTAFLISGSLIMFPKLEGSAKNFILTNGYPNVVVKPYITGTVTGWKMCSTSCTPTSNDGEKKIYA